MQQLKIALPGKILGKNGTGKIGTGKRGTQILNFSKPQTQTFNLNPPIPNLQLSP